MTYLKSFLTISMVMLTVSCSNVDRSRSFGDPSVNGKTLAQQVCSNCHGIDGNSGSEQFPKLAGQQKEYLLLQLKSFNDHSRTDRLAQEIMAGMSRDRSARLIDAISASGVEWETQLCFFVFAARGIKDLGPTSAMNAPDVDRKVSLSPAKSASA